MIDIEKLKKEIKGRIRKNVYLDYHEGYNDALKRTLSIIESMQKEPQANSIDFEQELYKTFGRVNDFTLCTQIAKRFYEKGVEEGKRRVIVKDKLKIKLIKEV